MTHAGHSALEWRDGTVSAGLGDGWGLAASLGGDGSTSCLCWLGWLLLTSSTISSPGTAEVLAGLGAGGARHQLRARRPWQAPWDILCTKHGTAACPDGPLLPGWGWGQCRNARSPAQGLPHSKGPLPPGGDSGAALRTPEMSSLEGRGSWHFVGTL